MGYPIRASADNSLKSTLINALSGQKRGATVVRALNNVSFEVYQGERVGLIGANGSGKTTLLRTIAGLYPPASGQVVVRGPLRSLFELGIGLDLEEPGRSNIYNRGYAMGASRQVIAAAEQSIIDFAALGEFIDLPMKSYSSGMQVKLMFAIATSFDADVLLLDEFFGAGDAIFMSRAQARMQELLLKSGCVVIATHSTHSAIAICTRCIWLRQGEIAMDGDPAEVCDAYTQWAAETAAAIGVHALAGTRV
jgi:lipopolysaccharide transport system ATP-binding protein